MFIALLMPKHQHTFFSSRNQKVSVFGKGKGNHGLRVPMVYFGFWDIFVVFQTQAGVELKQVIDISNFALDITKGQNIAFKAERWNFLNMF